MNSTGSRIEISGLVILFINDKEETNVIFCSFSFLSVFVSFFSVGQREKEKRSKTICAFCRSYSCLTRDCGLFLAKNDGVFFSIFFSSGRETNRN